jgi:putative tryptophan/tyrosine transport system substrate-binding protein
MHRRDFIWIAAGAGVAGAAARPLAARAQQAPSIRRIALFGFGIETGFGNQLIAAFKDALKNLGWTEGRNVRIDIRYSGSDYSRLETLSQDLVRSGPEVIVAFGGPSRQAVQRQTRTIPIVMVAGADPVATGTVDSIPRPTGNITGFASLFPSIGGKWVELLTEAVPGLRRIAVLGGNAESFDSSTYLPSIEAAAVALNVQAIRMPIRDAAEAESAVAAFASEPNGGLIILPPTAAAIVRSATQYRLPAISYFRTDVVENGCIMTYGADFLDLFKSAASYVDRILRGAKPSDLPIQFPTRFPLVVNLKTAKAIGVTIPELFLSVRADEVIE